MPIIPFIEQIFFQSPRDSLNIKDHFNSVVILNLEPEFWKDKSRIVVRKDKM